MANFLEYDSSIIRHNSDSMYFRTLAKLLGVEKIETRIKIEKGLWNMRIRKRKSHKIQAQHDKVDRFVDKLEMQG